MSSDTNHSLAKFALAVVRLAVVASAFVCLYYVGRERWDKYVKNGIIQRRSVEHLDEPWFETAICFGPQLSEPVVHKYVNLTNGKAPGRYKKEKVYLKISADLYQAPPGYKVENKTHYYKYIYSASMAVDSVRNYGIFFGEQYNWTDDVFGVSSQPSARISQYLDSIHHTLTLDGTTLDHSLTHTDMPFMFHYSMCRNFSYGLAYNGSRGELVHQVVMNKTTHKSLLQSGVARYVDFFVYPRGDFTEFPLLADHISYRVDMRDHKLLNVVGEKTNKLMQKNRWECKETADYSYVNCITWCLMRGLLRKASCIMPVLVPYIYNVSGRIPSPGLDTHPGGSSNTSKEQFRIDFDWNELFPVDTAWPWMREFTHLKPCQSTESFAEVFKTLTKALYPRGDKKYPLSPNCSRECLPECSEYTVVMNLAGTKLILNEEDSDRSTSQEQTSDFINGVTLTHWTSLENINERWMYTWKQLFIDLSGVLSFLLGMSVIAIHDWCFTVIEWSMQKTGCMEDFPDNPEDNN